MNAQIKRTVSIIFFILAFIQLNSVCAQTCRTEKEIKALIKTAPRTKSFHYSTVGFGFKSKSYEFVSLKDLPKDKLTQFEKVLVSKFKDVAFGFQGGTLHHFYWLKDSINRIGVMTFDQKMLVPPVKGNIYHIWNNTAVVGEREFSENDWIKNWTESVQNHNGIALGHFCAVITNINSKDIHAIVPAGAYDDIMYAIKSNKPYWFVGKLKEDEIRWGVLNFNGKEEIPCEHKGIYKNNKKGGWIIGNVGGKWNTTEEMTMDEANNMVRNREQLALERRQRWAETLSDVGEGIITVANTIQDINAMSGNTQDSGSSKISNGDYESSYAKWAAIAKRHYNSLTNLGTTVKEGNKDVGGTTGQGESPHNYTQMKKALREAQSEMKKIRQKAKKEGIIIKESEYENIKVSY